jgi:hypothetical protein
MVENSDHRKTQCIAMRQQDATASDAHSADEAGLHNL